MTKERTQELIEMIAFRQSVSGKTGPMQSLEAAGLLQSSAIRSGRNRSVCRLK